MENTSEKVCLFCKRDEEKVPLVTLSYQHTNYWICPQHIPMLIHNPDQLQGMLPGAENMEAG